MTKSNLPQVIAALAAIATTAVLFSSVVSLADADKAALADAHTASALVAERAGGTLIR